MCEDAIAGYSEDFDKPKKHVVENIEPDLQLMIATHDKLLKCERVEQQDVSVLPLGGIINILHQHEHENDTNKSRI